MGLGRGNGWPLLCGESVLDNYPFIFGIFERIFEGAQPIPNEL
jgi:hypothetical protein